LQIQQATAGVFFLGLGFEVFNQKLWRPSSVKGGSVQAHYWDCEAVELLQSSPESCGASNLTSPSLDLTKTCEMH